MISLTSDIRDLPGIYKRYASPLEKLGIEKIEDFLYHIPFRYDDYTIISKISDLQPGETVTIRGVVKQIKNQYTRSRITIQNAIVEDDSGEISVVWFNQPYLTKAIKAKDHISLSGKIEIKPKGVQITSPDYEISENNFIHTGRLVPVYPETRGVSSKWIRRQTYKILNDNKENVNEFLPIELIEENKLSKLFDALYKIHFPENQKDIDIARKRLGFDELFTTQLAANIRRVDWEEELKSKPFDVSSYKKEIDDFIDSLPFKLTNAQLKAYRDISNDLSMEKPMNRLLEGDVGSGKTVVSAIAMYLAHLNGFQSVIMAPTEILANQHLKTIKELFHKMDINIGFATGSNKENLDKFDILIGTHAVIQDTIKYKNLGFVVIDEQQRFGVEQRGILRSKGDNPHVLTMTATPIPRTIALTLYGDLDLSILDEMPKGRKEIKTWLVPNEKRNDSDNWIKTQIKEKRSQVFVICPFIEESENMSSVKAATKEFERLKDDVFKECKVTLLHGKLKSKEKESVLDEFKNQKNDILVATPVVEVGIDIPNADIIVIEAAERFGLAQLHQLRGRVGRRDRQAYCLLFTENETEKTITRLKAMEKTNIGAELAELDLKLRGPGEIYGTAQSGRRYLKIASFSDFDLIKTTKKEADKYTKKVDDYKDLKKRIDKINIKIVNPD